MARRWREKGQPPAGRQCEIGQPPVMRGGGGSGEVEERTCFACVEHLEGSRGGEPLGSANFLEWDGSASRWHIPFLEPLASSSF
jgi:hypothetical protein